MKKIEYEWRSILCNKCNGYDHDSGDCRKTVGRKMWVQKQQLDKKGFVIITGKQKKIVIDNNTITTHNTFLALQSEEKQSDQMEAVSAAQGEKEVRVVMVGDTDDGMATRVLGEVFYCCSQY